MAFCECCECINEIEEGIVSLKESNAFSKPCTFFDIGIYFVRSGYVGNVCLEEKQEQLNVMGAAFWLYALNAGYGGFEWDETMAIPAPKYTSTLEDSFTDNYCVLIEDFITEEIKEELCETYFKLQEYFKDCCNINHPIGTCLNLADGGGWFPQTYIAQSIVIHVFAPWIRSSLNPLSISGPGVILGEWWKCGIGAGDCIDCWKSPTYPYWFINDDTFPQTGFTYEYWVEVSTYILDDRVVFDNSVWKSTGAILAGWTHRPGGTPGEWIKLS
jgi:hypothetical protein